MSAQASFQDTPKSSKIRRSHSGCKSCRKRGKRCDETKPSCRACIRLRLECSYGRDWSFRNACQSSLHQSAGLQLCKPLDSASDLENRYLDHFSYHVQYLLPAHSSIFTPKNILFPYLRSAILCISASNLSMLNTTVQSRALPCDSRRSVSSPMVNQIHEAQARVYHDQTLSNCHSITSSSNPNLTDLQADMPAILIALTILAYYHHASTNHLQFRFAVWDTVRFVSRHRNILVQSNDGRIALQMWYRLCVSHRLGKPPALLLEGEGESHYGPTRYSDSFENLYLDCILGMSVDDLIYDILIKTVEIRSRLVVFEVVSRCYGLSETSRSIGGTAYGVLSHLLGSDASESAFEEAQRGYMRGLHLRGLLDVQRERLKVWKTRLTKNQWPRKEASFSTHRDAMNALYALLCEITIDEFAYSGTYRSFVPRMMQIIDSLDLSTSTTADIYTFSLSEILLQLSLVYKSDTLFSYILDDLWPRLETKSRGYEHSHYPTHLVKRTIALLAECHSKGRNVRFALPAVTENIPKVKLMDIYYPIDLVICGSEREGNYFIERVNLP